MKVAINGFGRIGRLVFRIIESDYRFLKTVIFFISDIKFLLFVFIFL